MTKQALALAGSIVALAMAAPAQAAETVVLDTAGSSISVTSNPTGCFGNCKLTATPAFSQFAPLNLGSLDPGQSLTFTFANLKVGSGFGVGSATLNAVLALLSPAGSLASGGTANYFRFGGMFSVGGLTWANPSQVITGANGSHYTVTLNNLVGVQLGSSTAATATIAFDSAATPAVPEPASWALMIVGFGAAGYALRRRSAAVMATA